MESTDAAVRATVADAPPTSARQSVLLGGVKAVGLVAAAGLSAALAVRLVGSIRSASGAVTLVVGSLVGYLIADLLSGTVHWFCDTFFGEETPIIGRRLIQPFRDHHLRPQEITRYGLLEQDGSNYISLIPLLWLVRSWAPLGTVALLVQATLLGLAIGSLGTNLFHKWAHSGDVPSWVRWLQRCRLIRWSSPSKRQRRRRLARSSGIAAASSPVCSRSSSAGLGWAAWLRFATRTS
jgi:ubiquitin-conjugating enzyme E2 variant